MRRFIHYKYGQKYNIKLQIEMNTRFGYTIYVRGYLDRSFIRPAYS